MKTLDEVIKAFELCLDNKIKCNHCPYHEEGCPESRKADALNYLKVLQKMQKAQPLEKSEWDELFNQPLTWDKLCKMEATPVWLEWSSDGDVGAWGLIAYKVDNDIKFFRYGDDRCLTLTRDEYEPDKWQAYRKERK